MRRTTARRPRRRGAPSTVWWGGAVAGWCLVFAAVHVYWAAGGRAGLGAEAAAADQALATGWFFAYNLATAVLAGGGAVVAVLLARPAGGTGTRLRRSLRTGAGVACGVLLLRGSVGVTLMTRDLVRGDMDSPLLLAAVEPWFVFGGVLFGGLAAQARQAAQTVG